MKQDPVTGFARFDVKDPADLQRLVSSGLIWKSGPKAVHEALRAIMGGGVQRNEAKEPPEVTSYLNKAMSGGVTTDTETPAEDTAEPGEEPPVAPTAPTA